MFKQVVSLVLVLIVLLALFKFYGSVDGAITGVIDVVSKIIDRGSDLIVGIFR